MADKCAAPAVEPLLPVELGFGKIRFARGVKAGRWVFATGLMAQDFATGIAPDVLAERMPHGGRPKREKEAPRIFENLDAVLMPPAPTAATWCAPTSTTPPSRRCRPISRCAARCSAGRIPPSTSIAQQHLLLPGADMNIQALGVISGPGFEVDAPQAPAACRPADLRLFAGAHVGDFIFIPGITSLAVGDEPKRNGVAAAALMTEGAQWAGRRSSSKPSHRHPAHGAVAGARRRHARRRIHAQVISPTATTIPPSTSVVAAFRQVEAGARHHPLHRAGAAPYDGKIEINVHRGEARQRGGEEHVDAGVATAFLNQPQAVKAGDLLFTSGLMAIDRDGLVAATARDPRQPHFSSPAEAQAECIIDSIAKLCAAGGTSLTTWRAC